MSAPRFHFSSFIVSACLAGLCFLAPAQSFDLLSTIDSRIGPPSGGNGDSAAPVISRDGRYVLFASAANNLLLASNNAAMPGGYPLRLNVFLRAQCSKPVGGRSAPGVIRSM